MRFVPGIYSVVSFVTLLTPVFLNNSSFRQHGNSLNKSYLLWHISNVFCKNRKCILTTPKQNSLSFPFRIHLRWRYSVFNLKVSRRRPINSHNILPNHTNLNGINFLDYGAPSQIPVVNETAAILLAVKWLH